MSYTYEYPHPAVTVDVIVFTVDAGLLKVLLVRRGQDPFKGLWAMPGGFVEIDESLKRAAWRELREETGVRAAYLQQLGAFGRPDRDPRERIITVVYYATVPVGELRFRADSDAEDAALFDVTALPQLASDHNMIIGRARERLRQQAVEPAFGLRFLPATFTLSEFQAVCECVQGSTLDKRNFRKKIRQAGIIEATGSRRRDGPYRPAELFRRTA
jgi:ADP-ribose pyrophosphatase YjhB (NUDIX family)